MKKNKLIGALSTTALILCMSVSVFATEPNGATTNTTQEPKVESVTPDKDSTQRTAPNGEQRQKINDKAEAFSKLTNAQRREVYKIYENILSDQKKLIDKYVELNIMEKSKGDAMKLHMEEAFKKAKDKKAMPGMWREGKPRHDNNSAPNPEKAPTTEQNTEQTPAPSQGN